MAKRMRKGVKKGISIGIRIASIGKNEFERELKKVLSGRKIDRQRARKILGALLREARTSKKHFEAFAKSEARRVANKLKPLMKEAAKKAKKKPRRRKR